MSADDFARRFAAAFGAQDIEALAALIAADGTVLTLSGAWAEGTQTARVAFAAEASGLCARARLVTGKGDVLPLGPGFALVRQRYVVTGAIDETGAELPRFAAMLVAVLANGVAISLTFTALPG
jgi:ketosteroid isomerase-like protein